MDNTKLAKKSKPAMPARGKSSFDLYMKDISRRPLLSRDETVELFKRYEKGDQKAKETILESNLRLVVSIAKQYAHSGLDIEDLISEGNIGLMQAVDRFDWKRGFALSTYATWWIKRAIMRHMTMKSRTIRLPAHVINITQKMRKVRDEYLDEFGAEPSSEELHELLGISDRMFKAVESGAARAVSMNTNNASWQQAPELEAKLEDVEQESLDDHISQLELSHVVADALSSLTPKEEIVLRLRFGITDDASDQSKWPVTESELKRIESGKGLTNAKQRNSKKRTKKRKS